MKSFTPSLAYFLIVLGQLCLNSEVEINLNVRADDYKIQSVAALIKMKQMFHARLGRREAHLPGRLIGGLLTRLYLLD